MAEQRVLNGSSCGWRPSGIPLVVTNDLHYSTSSRADARTCPLRRRATTSTPGPDEVRGEEFWLKPADRMAAHVPRSARGDFSTPAGSPRWTDLDLPLGKAPDPALPGPDGHTVEDLAARGCQRGLPKRYADGDAGAPAAARLRAGVILSMGMPATS